MKKDSGPVEDFRQHLFSSTLRVLTFPVCYRRTHHTKPILGWDGYLKLGMALFSFENENGIYSMVKFGIFLFLALLHLELFAPQHISHNTGQGKIQY